MTCEQLSTSSALRGLLPRSPQSRAVGRHRRQPVRLSGRAEVQRPAEVDFWSMGEGGGEMSASAGRRGPTRGAGDDSGTAALHPHLIHTVAHHHRILLHCTAATLRPASFTASAALTLGCIFHQHLIEGNRALLIAPHSQHSGAALVCVVAHWACTVLSVGRSVHRLCYTSPTLLASTSRPPLPFPSTLRLLSGLLHLTIGRCASRPLTTLITLVVVHGSGADCALLRCRCCDGGCVRLLCPQMSKVGATVKDVPAQEFVTALAQHFKKVPPTAPHSSRAPLCHIRILPLRAFLPSSSSFPAHPLCAAAV